MQAAPGQAFMHFSARKREAKDMIFRFLFATVIDCSEGLSYRI